MSFRVHMAFNLGGRDLEVVQLHYGRLILTPDEVQKYLMREYIKEVGDGKDHNVVIAVEETCDVS